MYKKYMADFIEELSEMPEEVQEAVLENLSNKMEPIEIDGSIFMVHNKVSDLIDNLILQIKEYEKREQKWQKVEKLKA